MAHNGSLYPITKTGLLGLVANPNQWFEIRISLLFFWRDRERKLIRIFFLNDSIQDWFVNQRWFANILLNKNYGFLIRESRFESNFKLIRDSRIRNFWFATSSTDYFTIKARSVLKNYLTNIPPSITLQIGHKRNVHDILPKSPEFEGKVCKIAKIAIFGYSGCSKIAWQFS